MFIGCWHGPRYSFIGLDDAVGKEFILLLPFSGIGSSSSFACLFTFRTAPIFQQISNSMMAQNLGPNLRILFCSVFLFLLLPLGSSAQNLALTNSFEPRSRMLVLDGNLHFVAGLGKNISFRVSNGSSIRFGDTDILSLPDSTEIGAIRQLLASANGQLEGFGVQLSQQNSAWQERHTTMLEKYNLLTKQMAVQFNDSQSRARAGRRVRMLIGKLSKQIERLFKMMGTDECLGAPCKNGGTCIDGFGKFQCLCPSHFQGKVCDQRLDECAFFAGSDLGCQNNASCTNNPTTAGFSCNCTAGWHGRLCDHRENSCETGGWDICGEHGHCIPGGGPQSTMGYRCLCESGFRLGGDPANPVCVDVDECALHSPCYPGTECLNMPGSFKCGQCPAGLIGNGLHCVDFDECASEMTNDCSKQPLVECVNTHGGYKCGPCPPDFEGDGFNCRKISLCPLCHPDARCVEEPEFRCECPAGTVGNGVGAIGCEPNNQTLCSADSCLNGGTCQTVSDSQLRCHCPDGYFGPKCELPSHCVSRQFCSGHGRCHFNANTSGVGHSFYRCECFKGFYGPRCQFQEDDCGFHTTNETGELVYERSTAISPLFTRWTCTWHIQLFDTRKVLRIQFLNLTAPRLYEMTSKGCENSFATLAVFDGADPGESPSLASSQIANLCHGEDFAAPSQHPLFTSSSRAVIRLSSRLQGRSTFLRLNWTAVEPRCGGRFSNPGGGRIDFFEPVGGQREESACVWYISVPPQFHLELAVGTLRLPSGPAFNCSLNSLELFDSQLPANRTRVAQLCASLAVTQSPAIIRTSGPFAAIYLRLPEPEGGSNSKCQSPPCPPIGFSIRYSAVELPAGCGGQIRPDPETGRLEGQLQSPNFPHSYFPNLDCLWLFQVSDQQQQAQAQNGTASSLASVDQQPVDDAYQSEQKVELLFQEFDVPATVTQYANPLLRHVTISSCAGDFLAIPELDLTFCNMQRPPNSPIAAARLSLKFHSDAAIAGKGFSLRYRSVCQKDFSAPNGTISPPNFPGPSPKPFKCTYRIVGQPSQAIRLRFERIGLGTDFNSCFYQRDRLADSQDYIELAGGHPSNEVANRRYLCPRYPFVAPGGELVTSGAKPFSITYSSSGSATNKGFLFSYELLDIGCGGVFAISEEEAPGTQRQLTSPNYPDPYMPLLYCLYFLRVPSGKGLRLSFDVFDVENVAHREDCDFDSVRLYDTYSDEQDHGQLLGKFCGKSLPPPILSSSGQMALVFVSDRSVNGAGFSARFQAVDLASHCDRTFTAASGRFTFDSSQFEQADSCDYRIQIPSNRRILLSIENITAPCEFGSLLIRNGPSDQSPGFPGLFRNSEICDEHPQQRLVSQGNRLFLRFQAGVNRAIRFSLSYEQFDTGCGGHVSGFSGAISSPQFPHKDSQSLRCEWLVAVAPGNQVRLQIVQMDELGSEDGQGKCSPFGRNLLELAEGPDWAELLRRYCRRELNPRPEQSRANSLAVRFSQHGGSHHPAIFGFLAHFSTVCTDIVLEGQQGTLQSPGYPGPVLEARSCQWTIRTSPGSRIELQFHRFRVTDTGVSSSSSDLSSRHRRSLHFVARVRVNPCRRNFLEIEPKQIRSLSGTRLGQAFAVNETGSKAAMNSRFCLGAVEPMEVLSEHNQLQLGFQSRDEPENHFWLSWRTVGCGGQITLNDSLLLANASEGGDFAAGDPLRKCVWTIRAPLGHSVQVLVERMETEPVPGGQKCFELKAAGSDAGEKAELRDGVQFYADDFAFDRLNSGGQLPLKAMCGRVRNETFSWAGSQLAVVFTYHSDTSQAMADSVVGTLFGTLDEIDDHLVFRARVRFRPLTTETGRQQGQKGGVVHVDVRSDAFIQSPNYPQPYPKSVEMAWQFEAPEGFRVAFQLLNLSSPAASILGYTRAAGRLLNSSEPEDYSCGYYLLYMRGGLLFSDGEVASGSQLYGPQTRYRICQEVQMRPLEITMAGNVSVVTFRGAPYDQAVAAGDSGPASSASSPSQQKPIGFRLRAFAKCGGTLWVSSERKVVDTARVGGSSECEWTLKRNDSDDQTGQKTFVRVEELIVGQSLAVASPGSTEAPQLEVFCGPESKGVIETGELGPMGSSQQHFREFSCDGQVRLVARNLNEAAAGSSLLISYDTEDTFCGGQLLGHEGRLALGPVPVPSDCEWTVDAVAGAHVVVFIARLQLPVSEFCSDSFLEFREGNASGQLIGRFCGIFPQQVESQGPLWIRLRHKPEAEVGEDGAGDHELLPELERARELAGGGSHATGIQLKYAKAYGQTASHWIESPPPGLDRPVSWRISTRDPEHWIRFVFTELQLAQFSASLSVYPSWCFLQPSGPEEEPCHDLDSLALHFSAQLPSRLRQPQVIRSNRATLLFVPKLYGRFRMHWTEISQNGTEEAQQQQQQGTEQSQQGQDGGTFSCGGELEPKWEPQTLTNPTEPPHSPLYRNNERCKWTLRRPQFASIQLNLTELELESHPNCQYDWLAMGNENAESPAEMDSIAELQRICRKGSVPLTVEVNSADWAFVYFYTDRSRTFRGFTLNYGLSCNSIELWPVEKGLLETTLTSPGYPAAGRESTRSCQWSILLLSRRDILVQALDMDLAPRDWQSQQCVQESLEFSNTPFAYMGIADADNQTAIFCGQEHVEKRMAGGYLFIRLRRAQEPGNSRGRGFKLRLREVVHDCASSVVQLDQLNPARALSSPEYPSLSPDSLDCQWILSAPAGRRLQFTVDPHSFWLQNPISEDRCEEDFLEIRDGPSRASPLLGRFCQQNPPSTMLSTGEYMFVRYVTDSDTKSPGWNGTVELATCGGSLVLVPGQNATLHSPNYPDVYPAKVRCQWAVKAPKGHFVEAMLEHFWLAGSENCSAEFLAIRDQNAESGDYLQKPVCTRMALSSGGVYRSSHQSIHVQFVVEGTSPGISRSSRLFCLSRKCGFQLRLWASKFACGGTVSDDSGRLRPPGFEEGRLVPGLVCQWDFRADIGHRYRLELEWPGSREDQQKALTAEGFGRRKCLGSLEAYDGVGTSGVVRLFCDNGTSLVSQTDVLTLVYKNPSQLPESIGRIGMPQEDRPFQINYDKVPKDFDNSSCMFELTESGSVSIGRSQQNQFSRFYALSTPDSTAPRIPFCHIQIRKPSADQTVHLLLSNLTFGTSLYGSELRKCLPRDSRITIKDEFADPIDLEVILCRATLRGENKTSLVLDNSQVDIFVQNFPTQDWVRFDLAVSFHDCGGLVDADRVGFSGEVSSPDFGSGNYSNGLECLWLLRAPEGRVVTLEFTAMDLEHHIECAHDFLEVHSGEQQSPAVLHRYCNSDSDEKLPERFRRIRSFGRSLSLYFHTDASVVGRGFSAQFAFVPPGDQCGFNAHSPNGSLQSPGYPTDYPANTNCVWDLQVPTGFHILLSFDFFDVVQSPDCNHDFLKISEEHQSRAVSPLLSYYFYFDHEAPGQKLCGNQLPAPIRTESNRVRLNFTSDARKSARGFKLHWQAVCGGAVFRNNHGVITSPHYPAFYPNEDAQCDYLVDPETQPGTTQIVTLKVLDLDLDRETHTGIGRPTAGPRTRYCQSDFLEIRDVLRNVTVQLLCGATYQADTAEAVSIKGPIGVRFLTNRSSTHETWGKNHRGFKLSYALSECGGDVNLDSSRLSGTISSPGFPLPYHHSLDCLWNVTAPAGRVISYKFTDLKMESDTECQFDAVETFDGAEMSNQSRMIRLCGDKAPEGELKSTSPNLLVHFSSDHSANFDGFRMVLTATLGPANGCGGWLNASKDWQKLGAPVDPHSGRHFPNLRCEWNVQAPVGRIIEIRLLSLELEQKPPVADRQNATMSLTAAERIPCFDYASIYDGPKATSPFLLAPACSLPSDSAGEQLQPSLFSSHRRVDVFFYSDSSMELPGGFQAEFRSVEADCGGAVLAGSDWGNLSYTSERTLKRTNQRHKRCRWFIYTEERQPVEVMFEQFSFPSAAGNGCVDEFVELRDVGALSECQHPACAREAHQSRESIRSCGNYAPHWHISSTSVLQLTASVLLQSQFSATFRLRFRALSACNRTVEIDGDAPDGVSLASGRLTSPNFPHSPYSHNDSCTTQILAAEGHRIFLVFKTFELERGRYLTPRQRWQFAPLWWQRDGGMGSSRLPRRIPAPSPSETAGAQNCIYDSLTIYANSTDPPFGQTFCGSTLPPSILSEQNQVQLVLNTDATVAGSGYELSYYSVVLSQTPSLKLFELAPSRERTGALTSIDYPGPYPANSLFRATLIPPVGLRCIAQVLRAEFGGDCRARIGRFPARSALSPLDVASRDYYVPNFNSLEWNPWPCSVDAPHKLPIPPGHQLIIEFRADSDSSNDGIGFRLVWDCEDISQ